MKSNFGIKNSPSNSPQKVSFMRLGFRKKIIIRNAQEKNT
jgi:hypothetical protein